MGCCSAAVYSLWPRRAARQKSDEASDECPPAEPEAGRRKTEDGRRNKRGRTCARPLWDRPVIAHRSDRRKAQCLSPTTILFSTLLTPEVSLASFIAVSISAWLFMWSPVR